MSQDTPHPRHLSAVRRDGERVTPLELFFDLAFVLAITQCTALIAAHPDWGGLAQGLLALGVLWWAWVGYAWLTSVVDPEEGVARLTIFAAMAGLLVVALCVPDAFTDQAVTLAIAYGVVRCAHIVLFVIASRDDPDLRRSVWGLAVSTALGVGLVAVAAFTAGVAAGALWAAALLVDMGGPLLFGAAGWRLVPGHFAERHGLFVIIALGESIVAIGVGAAGGVDAGILVAAVAGMGLAAALWWIYFDMAALKSARNLEEEPEGRRRNEMARDAYSFLHLPLVAAIVLCAFGLKVTIAHTGDGLDLVASTALVGGTALYLLGHVAFRYRTGHHVDGARLVAGVVLVALVPVATLVPALVALGALDVAVWALITYEVVRYAALRREVRHGLGTATS